MRGEHQGDQGQHTEQGQERDAPSAHEGIPPNWQEGQVSWCPIKLAQGGGRCKGARTLRRAGRCAGA
nr:hypothetical protein StreXyl84_71160 [Streptomyces sp. Xyl84]